MWDAFILLCGGKGNWKVIVIDEYILYHYHLSVKSDQRESLRGFSQ
jgi:hypothetical protein